MKCQFKLLYLLFGKKVCKKCPWNVTLKGPINKDNKREDISKCAIAWVPMLMTEIRSSIDGISALGSQLIASKNSKKQEEQPKEKRPE